MMTLKRSISLILLSTLTVFSCKPDHPLDKKEAVNNIRALDSEIIGLAEQISETPAVRALEFLKNQSSSPLPFKNDTSARLSGHPPYSFAVKKGVYQWDTITGSFVKQKDTTVILLHFPLIDRPKSACRFLLSDYQTRDTKSRPGFPVSAEAKLFIDGHEELTVSHHAVLSENMLSAIITDAHAGDFDLHFHLARTGDFSQQSGILKGDLKIQEGKKEIINMEFKIDIDYHPPVAYSVRYIRFLMTVFETELKADINYGAINPTSGHYADEFNSNSKIFLKNLENRGIIGNIVLSLNTGKDKLDYFIRFSDGTESLLSDQFIILKKLIHLKY
jgi:hypothetical protein